MKKDITIKTLDKINYNINKMHKLILHAKPYGSQLDLQLRIVDIGLLCEEIIDTIPGEKVCHTCKKPIKKNEYYVDDGIKKGAYHHQKCY